VKTNGTTGESRCHSAPHQLDVNPPRICEHVMSRSQRSLRCWANRCKYRSLEKMTEFLPYDPGILPSAPPPRPGDTISVRLDGLPPYKDEHFSIRNPRHKIHARFMALRQGAIQAMSGRAPYRGAIGLDFVMHTPEFEKNRTLTDYMGGIMDALDGSHGAQFTYLPVVYEDDCQVCDGRNQFRPSTNRFYEITVQFLPETVDGEQSPRLSPERRAGVQVEDQLVQGAVQSGGASVTHPTLLRSRLTSGAPPGLEKEGES